MKRFMRPYIHLGVAALWCAGTTMLPPGIAAQSSRIAQIIEEPSPFLLHPNSQGYLGVLVGDVDSESAPKLKLKDVRGAVITLIDHDAPAAQAGLRVNDVVTEINGQVVEGSEQFGRMMREIPAGHKVNIVISRDGVPQTIMVQLADRKTMEHDVWNKLGSGSEKTGSAPGMAILGNGGDAPLPGGFHMPFFGSTSLNVGAMVEPLTSQMAEYLGVPTGLMVKQVVRKSEASAAGFKAFDVIIKVGADAISTLSDWDRSLRTNQGKQVQVTILRDKKQQTLTLQVDSKHKGEVDFEDIFSGNACPLMAGVDPATELQLLQQFAGSESNLLSMREQVEALKDQFGASQDENGAMNFGFTPQQAEEFRKQAEAMRDSLKVEDFKLDQKQLDETKRQLEDMHKNFKPEDFNFEHFKIDPKQMQELQKQMDQFKRQMDQLQLHGFGVHV